jgi:hypothetical protein
LTDDADDSDKAPPQAHRGFRRGRPSLEMKFNPYHPRTIKVGLAVITEAPQVGIIETCKTRKFDCKHYLECVGRVASQRQQWCGWTCKDCPVDDPVSSRERYDEAAEVASVANNPYRGGY